MPLGAEEGQPRRADVTTSLREVTGLQHRGARDRQRQRGRLGSRDGELDLLRRRGVGATPLVEDAQVLAGDDLPLGFALAGETRRRCLIQADGRRRVVVQRGVSQHQRGPWMGRVSPAELPQPRPGGGAQPALHRRLIDAQQVLIRPAGARGGAVLERRGGRLDGRAVHGSRPSPGPPTLPAESVGPSARRGVYAPATSDVTTDQPGQPPQLSCAPTRPEGGPAALRPRLNRHLIGPDVFQHGRGHRRQRGAAENRDPCAQLHQLAGRDRDIELDRRGRAQLAISEAQPPCSAGCEARFGRATGDPEPSSDTAARTVWPGANVCRPLVMTMNGRQDLCLHAGARGERGQSQSGEAQGHRSAEARYRRRQSPHWRISLKTEGSIGAGCQADRFTPIAC